MVVDGVGRLYDVELGGRSLGGVCEGEEEGGGGAGKLASLEPTAPGDISISTKHTPTGSLRIRECRNETLALN